MTRKLKVYWCTVFARRGWDAGSRPAHNQPVVSIKTHAHREEFALTTIVRRRAQPAAPTRAHTTHARPSATIAAPLSKEELLHAIKTQMMTAEQVADLAGIASRSVSIYHTVAPYKMPQPDVRLGRTPLWWRETIVEWDSTRPKKRDKVRT